jgi:hypothetical protein
MKVTQRRDAGYVDASIGTISESVVSDADAVGGKADFAEPASKRSRLSGLPRHPLKDPHASLPILAVLFTRTL